MNPKVYGIAKNRSNDWIPAFAGMAIRQLISNRYHQRHTREGGYPGAEMTCYDYIKVEIPKIEEEPQKCPNQSSLTYQNAPGVDTVN